MELKDRVVVITGSSSGIGEATAYRFAKEGAKIVVNALTNTEGGDRVVERIRAEGGEAVFFRADVSDPIQAKALMDYAIHTYGAIDVLINNAGGWEEQDFLTSSKEQWMRILDRNVFTTIHGSQFAAQHMLSRGFGKILNTSSVYGGDYTGDPTAMAYSIGKAAVNSLTKNLAKMWAPKILVNAVAPGYVHLPRFDQFPDELAKTMKAEMAIGRWIEPAEVAEAFVYLAKADGVTGEIHRLDGGFGLM